MIMKTPTTEELFERYTYTIQGIPFIFYEDVHKIIGKKKMKKWSKMSAGSTTLFLAIGDKIVPGEKRYCGIYPHDLKKFMRLDKKGC